MRRGFTLIEVLATIVVLVVISAITIPILKSSRDRAREVQCLCNMRQSGLLLTTYSDAYADHLPFAGRKPSDGTYPPQAERRAIKFGGTWSIWNGTWSLLFPAEWKGTRWNPAYQCPRQRPFDSTATEYTNGWFDLPMYWMTDVVGYDAVTMRKGMTLEGIKPAPNRASNVRFPSRKVYLWEEFAFCTPHSDTPGWLKDQWSVMVPTSILLFDGSVDRTIRNEQIPGLENAMPYSHTVDGIYGRDVH